MIFKIITVVLLLLIAGSLFFSLRSLLTNTGSSDAMSKALSVCVGLSTLLLLLLFVFNQLGWLVPHSLIPQPPEDQSQAEDAQRDDSGTRYRAP